MNASIYVMLVSLYVQRKCFTNFIRPQAAETLERVQKFLTDLWHCIGLTAHLYMLFVATHAKK